MEGGEMPRKKHAPEQVIKKLHEAELAMAQGSTVAEARRRAVGPERASDSGLRRSHPAEPELLRGLPQ